MHPFTIVKLLLIVELCHCWNLALLAKYSYTGQCRAVSCSWHDALSSCTGSVYLTSVHHGAAAVARLAQAASNCGYKPKGCTNEPTCHLLALKIRLEAVHIATP
eukprot:4807214-Amphidinium_carterae.1